MRTIRIYTKQLALSGGRTASSNTWTAFSRDQVRRHYVQDRLHEALDRLREWVERGAAIYVCGSLDGMATGVHRVQEDVLGQEALEALAGGWAVSAGCVLTG